MSAMLYRNLMLSKRVLWMTPLYSFFYVFMFCSSLTMLAGGMFMAAYLFVVMVFGYEEQAKALAMNKAMPVSNGTVVAAYYVGALLSILYALLWYVVIINVHSAIRPDTLLPTLLDVLMALGMSIILASIQLPIVIKFGALKTRMLNMLFLLVVFTLPGIVEIVGMDLSTLSAFGVFLIAVIGSLASYLLGVKIYNKKETD